MKELKVKLIHPAAKIPVRMTRGSAGLDLFASENIEVPPTRCDSEGYADVGRALVPTGIVLQLPTGTVGRIGSRSGLSVNSNIETGAGWIDNDYRGEIKVELKNFSSQAYRVNSGDRIAQLVILPLEDVEAVSVSELEDTQRGSSGFGSTDDQ